MTDPEVEFAMPCRRYSLENNKKVVKLCEAFMMEGGRIGRCWTIHLNETSVECTVMTQRRDKQIVLIPMYVELVADVYKK
jgi:hypothetical protein